MGAANLLGNFLHDVRFAFRTIIQHPAFSTVVVLTLALGIGVNTAIFSLVNAILLRPLGFPHSEELVKIWDRSLPYGGFVSLHERLRSFEAATYAHESGFNLTLNGEASRVVADGISTNLFSVLQVKPMLGRDFIPEDKTGRHAIISHSLWQNQFAGDPRILGRHIILDEKPFEVIGVMPPGFNYPYTTQIWALIDFEPGDTMYWGWGYNVIGRLRPGNTIAQASSEFRLVFPEILKLVPFVLPAGYGEGADVAPLQEFSVSKARTTLLVLFGAVFLILLVACVNVANLLLARGATRQKEIAVRAALGAGRFRIMLQLLTESVILGVMGGAVGSALGLVSLGLLKKIMPEDTPRLAEVSIDWHVLAYATMLSFAVGLVFGLAPALQASRPDLEQTLRSTSQGSGAGSRRSRITSALVVAEIAMAMILVSGAGLLIKSLWLLNNMNTGVQQEDQLVMARVTPSWTYYRQTDQCGTFFRQVLQRIRELPGVKSAALSDAFPLENFFGASVVAQDRPETTTAPYSGWLFIVSPGYFQTMGIPLLRGRDFTDADQQKAPGVVLISRTMAERLWPGADPIGKRVRSTSSKGWNTVIGVVEDVQHYSATPVAFNPNAHGDIYYSSQQGLGQLPFFLDVVVRADGEIPVLKREITSAVSQVNSIVPVSNWRTMRQLISRSIARPRSTTLLFMMFSILALVLGLVGIYSVISYAVVQRTREIGVRMALGADRPNILKMIVGHGASLTLLGLILGLAGAMALTRYLASLLYEVSPLDPLIYTIVIAIIALAAVLATYVPARRATKVNPNVALRCE
ncbi:MAG: hypothetical protein DMG65_05205 [Candidatus Angelobacter sp. Gp1-AA117]|nr:MAG: hypothetical protein DMG65_05205 [Candidatus Angelobacter sp. Gp1-AA117]